MAVVFSLASFGAQQAWRGRERQRQARGRGLVRARYLQARDEPVRRGPVVVAKAAGGEHDRRARRAAQVKGRRGARRYYARWPVRAPAGAHGFRNLGAHWIPNDTCLSLVLPGVVSVRDACAWTKICQRFSVPGIVNAS
jgi:hypothetical protein